MPDCAPQFDEDERSSGPALICKDLGMRSSEHATSAVEIAQIVEGWSTALAFLAAAVGGWFLWRAAVYTRNLFTIETNRDAAQIRASQRAQADLISTWISRDSRVFVRNNSYQPIFAIEVHLILAGRAVQLGPMLDVLGPLPHLVNVSDHVTPELDPATIQEIESLRANRQTAGSAIVFRDAAGRDWTRRPDGDLRPGRDLFEA